MAARVVGSPDRFRTSRATSTAISLSCSSRGARGSNTTTRLLSPLPRSTSRNAPGVPRCGRRSQPSHLASARGFPLGRGFPVARRYCVAIARKRGIVRGPRLWRYGAGGARGERFCTLRIIPTGIESPARPMVTVDPERARVARLVGQLWPDGDAPPSVYARAVLELYGPATMPRGAAELLESVGVCAFCLQSCEDCDCCCCVCFCPSGAPLGTEGVHCHCLTDPKCPQHGRDLPW